METGSLTEKKNGAAGLTRSRPVSLISRVEGGGTQVSLNGLGKRKCLSWSPIKKGKKRGRKSWKL